MNMGTHVSKSSLLKACLLEASAATGLLLLTGGLALAADTTAVTLTAAPTGTTLPDGQTVPMWGLMCGTVAGSPAVFTYVPGTDSTGVPVTAPCKTLTGATPAGTWQPPLI